MKTKQEVIQDAWGEHWETVKDKIKFKSWLDDDDIESEELLKWVNENCYLAHIPDRLWRPKKLQNLESNNGWTIINSEKDLPKNEDIIDFWVYEDEEIVSAQFMHESKRWYSDVDLSMRLYPTQYQPNVKPNLPIHK